MVKKIIAVVLGYVAMAAFVFLTFSVAYVVMGADGAFKPDSYEVTALWIGVSIVLGLAAALLGGFVCAAISRSSRTPMVLAGLVLVLGLLMALPAAKNADEATLTTRTGATGNFEAMQKARQPTWVAFLNPFLGAAGVMLGSRLKGKSDGHTGQG